MRRRTALFLIPAALAAQSALADCSHTEDHDFELDVAGVRQVRIEAAAGLLAVEGKSGLEKVVVRGTACAERASDLERVELDVERRGDEILIVARIDTASTWREQPWLDLEIDVPVGMDLDVRDSSGGLEIFGVGALELEDSSGSIRLEGIHGDLRIEDGSGEIDVREVDGRVLVANDGSGGITIRDAGGDVEIRRDGSGGIEVSDVRGSVRIGSDGSGSIWAHDVTGDFIVESDGSGGISFDRIGGRIDLP